MITIVVTQIHQDDLEYLNYSSCFALVEVLFIVSILHMQN